MRRRGLCGMVCTLAALVTAGCAASSVGTGHGQRQRGAAPSRRARVVTVATDAAFSPFHFVDERGEITGHDVALIRHVLERCGYDVRVVRVTPYQALFEGLLSGRHDVVAATTGITPQRQRKYLFSSPYFETCQATIVRRGADEPRSLSGLAGRRVGAAGSGTSLLAAQAVVGATVVQLDKGSDGVPALLAGDIDALVVDEFDAVAIARGRPDALRVLSQPVAVEQYAFVMRLGDIRLKRDIDGALEASVRDGTVGAVRATFGVARDAAWPVNVGGDAPAQPAG